MEGRSRSDDRSSSCFAPKRDGLCSPSRQVADKTSAGGKSELHRAMRRVTPGQGDLTESGTENIPPRLRFRLLEARASAGKPVMKVGLLLVARMLEGRRAEAR